MKRDGMPLGPAELGLVGPIAKPPLGLPPHSNPLSSVSTSEWITMGPSTQPDRRKFRTTTLYTIQWGAHFHSSLSGHGAKRRPKTQTRKQRRVHRLSDYMTQFAPRREALRSTLPFRSLVIALKPGMLPRAGPPRRR